MSAELRAELFKLRSTRTALWLGAALLGLVVFVVSLHGFGLAATTFHGSAKQRTMLFGWGEALGALFAALLGAMTVTSEFRHGTIRPTFLVTPERPRVVAAKAWASSLIGTGFGLVAGVAAAGVGTAALRTRGIDVQIGTGDYALLIVGGTAAATLWAAIGAGVGVVVRNQVPALVGITVWLLFVETVLLGDIGGIDDIARFLPGAAGKAISGQDPDKLLSPVAGLVVLVLYAIAATVAGGLAIERRDID